VVIFGIRCKSKPADKIVVTKLINKCVLKLSHRLLPPLILATSLDNCLASISIWLSFNFFGFTCFDFLCKILKSENENQASDCMIIGYCEPLVFNIHVHSIGNIRWHIKQVNLYNQILIQNKSLYHISYIKTEETLH
jgi:hypothetical protein